jgi:hypothetical protein
MIKARLFVGRSIGKFPLSVNGETTQYHFPAGVASNKSGKYQIYSSAKPPAMPGRMAKAIPLRGISNIALIGRNQVTGWADGHDWSSRLILQ